MFFLREYLLYVVKAGHIAVLVELLDGRPLPDGKGQVAYGTSVVKQRFVQSSVLFALDRLLKGVIRMMTRVVEGVANFLPIPGTQAIVGLIRGMLKLSVGFLDELILLVWMLPGQLSALTLIFALVFAWAAKAALLEPLALVCMMQAYFKVIEGQVPDPVWDQRLTQMSGKFGKIKQQAIDWVPQPSAAANSAASPTPVTQAGNGEG